MSLEVLGSVVQYLRRLSEPSGVREASGEQLLERFVVHRDEAAFAAQQQTPHFKSLILGEGVPRLKRRERMQYAVL